MVLTTFTSQEARIAHRAEHRVYLRANADAGKLLMAGPFVDETGGFIVFEATDEAEVKAIMAADPFSTEGVFKTIEIKEFTQVAGA
ncbi:MAG: YciI family protein [Thermomicrobiales bacterium]